jgi:hypothetical protein
MKTILLLKNTMSLSLIMKRKNILSIALFLMLMPSCMQTRYLTEQFIKTKIEEHNDREFSSIRTYSIYQSSSSFKFYLEFTGYKYKERKGLVIGADKYYLARQKFPGDKTIMAAVTYIELNMEECKSILDNYEVLQQKINNETPYGSEEVYHDFTVNKDLFISFRKSVYGTSTTINFWIRGEKYIVFTRTMLIKLQEFMNY